VLGEDHSHIFPVEILASKNVGTLKQVIKEKKKHAFDHIDADALVLWKVDFTTDRSLQENLKNAKFTNERQLMPLDFLSEHFSEPLLQNPRIVIKAPPPGEYS
jgi:Crinkler effector protein N-terminal domain